MKQPGLTILGTDTDVGKTYVACLIIQSLMKQGFRVGAYKPVASGASSVEQSDGFLLWLATGQRRSLDDVNPQFFQAPLAPPIAAELEGKQVSEIQILAGARKWSDGCDLIVVEGAGGLMSPISWTMTNANLALDLSFPVILVAANRLGVVNQVLTSLLAARTLGLKVGCIVLNDVHRNEELCSGANERMLRRFLEQDTKHVEIARLSHAAKEFTPNVDWIGIASGPGE